MKVLGYLETGTMILKIKVRNKFYVLVCVGNELGFTKPQYGSATIKFHFPRTINQKYLDV